MGLGPCRCCGEPTPTILVWMAGYPRKGKKKGGKGGRGEGRRGEAKRRSVVQDTEDCPILQVVP